MVFEDINCSIVWLPLSDMKESKNFIFEANLLLDNHKIMKMKNYSRQLSAIQKVVKINPSMAQKIAHFADQIAE